MGRKISDQEPIQLTSRIIHGFYERRSKDLIPYLSPEFMWIGGLDYQWSKNLPEFLQITKDEMKETAVMISSEEYHLLLRESTLAVLCGRYTATAFQDNTAEFSVHARITIVWRLAEDQPLVLHMHGSHASDYPPHDSFSHPQKTGAGVLNYLHEFYGQKQLPQPLFLPGPKNDLQRLYPAQILYIEAANQWCMIHSAGESVLTRGGISQMAERFPGFIRVHRRYLVNPIFVSSLKRYELQLKDGSVLPVSRGRYMEAKRLLGFILPSPLSSGDSEPPSE